MADNWWFTPTMAFFISVESVGCMSRPTRSLCMFLKTRAGVSVNGQLLTTKIRYGSQAEEIYIQVGNTHNYKIQHRLLRKTTKCWKCRKPTNKVSTDHCRITLTSPGYIVAALIAIIFEHIKFNRLKPKTYFMYHPPALTFRNSVFCPQCIYVFCVDLRTNSDFLSIQH